MGDTYHKDESVGTSDRNSGHSGREARCHELLVSPRQHVVEADDLGEFEDVEEDETGVLDPGRWIWTEIRCGPSFSGCPIYRAKVPWI